MKQFFIRLIFLSSVDVSVQYTFTKCYPDEVPLMEVASSNNLSEKDEEELLNILNEEVNI